MPHSAAETVRNYIDLTKPRLLPLVLFSGLPIMGMAPSGWAPFSTAALIMIGIALAAASANTLNAYLEIDKDSLMERTRGRPLPCGRIEPRHALIFGIVLALSSIAFLWAIGGMSAAALGLASILFYVFVYTLWLKPRSAWNVVIGGAAGAVSPLIADTALHGAIGPAGLCVFALVLFWQPPHVWAIALYRKADYEAAGIPMLPSVVGNGPTRWWMLVCTLLLVPVSLAPALLGLVGNLYVVSALAANAWFVASSIQVIRLKSEAAARTMFRVSLGYLFAVLAAMLLDLALADLFWNVAS
ncbi:MAG: protoheme IX farnesyltransferase [Deltaproteobacteria bacterium]|nr:protoheme IX farnesyltransferase [Deltaproteobacteria bacterium]MBW2395542.1 protoheme IX farnesyltransferase [Deltaproteobacteria bacterium]